MRTVHRMIPINLVVPFKYDISIILNGDSSTLELIEKYDADVPESLFGPTVTLMSALLPKATVKRLDNVKGISLSLIGTETEIINIMIGEFSTIREDPCLPYPSIPFHPIGEVNAH